MLPGIGQILEVSLTKGVQSGFFVGEKMNQLFVADRGFMVSSSLLELVNKAREASGEKPVRHNDFLARCKDELDGDDYESFVVQNSNKTSTEYLKLTEDQCKLVAMRESKSVRRAVLEELKRIQPSTPSIPDFSNPAAAARAWAEQFELAQAILIERDQAVATKAEIGNRREATAMNTASQATKKVAALQVQLDTSAQFCTIKRMQMLKHGQPFDWRKLKHACAEMGIEAIDVFDQNYGTVKAYHEEVWLEVYGLRIEA